MLPASPLERRGIRREHLLISPNPSQPHYSNPARLILVLAIAPAIGLGICRFAYSLVLPDMRESLGWSYSTAGFMNTINAAGYLAGALGASAFIRRFGLFDTLRISAAACVLSLVLSALTANFSIFSAVRLVSGVAAAFAFVAGGALATNVAQAQPQRQAFYLSLFYIGPAVGILISGFVSPFLLEWNGPGSWWIVWAALAAISSLMAIVLPLARVDEPPAQTVSASAEIRISPVLIYLISYFLFGAGYIAYMTFMIAYVRNAGGGALAQSAFWTCIGIGAFAQPWVWGGVLGRNHNGRVTALLIGLTAVGAAIPLLGTSPVLLAASALIFGNAFFAVVSSTTAFARLNYPREAWPKAIAMMTVAFGIGQTLGPIATGFITDKMGSLSYALNVSAVVIVLGVIACICQRPIPQATHSRGVASPQLGSSRQGSRA
jgi:predicted MFS family arabinose efflux permease